MDKEGLKGYIPIDNESIPAVLRGLELLQQDCLRAAGSFLSQASGSDGDKLVIERAENYLRQGKEAQALADQIALLNQETASHPDIDELAKFLQIHFPSEIKSGRVVDLAMDLLSEYYQTSVATP